MSRDIEAGLARIGFARKNNQNYQPQCHITYIVFLDSIREVRTYLGFNASTGMRTGPTIVMRQDWARSNRETLTMSATPSVTSGRPIGSESISRIQSLSREVIHSVGQIIYIDEYVDLTGRSRSQASVTLGTAGDHSTFRLPDERP